MDEKLEKLEDTSESSSEIASSWNSSHEDLLASIGDRCNCYRWLHERCQVSFDKYNFYLTIPSVIISTLAGSATIAAPSMLSEQNQKTAGVVVGIFTLTCGVLTSVNQYMKTSQCSEAHRQAAIAYGKLHRVISSELALRRDQRTNAMDFIKVIRSEQDRLQETTPNILDSVIGHFREHFKDVTDVDKPEIVGDLDHVRVNVSQKHESSSPKQDSFPIKRINARYSPPGIIVPE
jgi:hypothetical protein